MIIMQKTPSEDFAESFNFFVEIEDNGGISIIESKRNKYIEDWRYEWFEDYICSNYKCILFIYKGWFIGSEGGQDVEM